MPESRVETTGALAELMQAQQSTGRLDPAGKITIVDRSPMLLGQFSSKAHDYALQTHRGRCGRQARGRCHRRPPRPDRVEFDDNTTIPARTVVWGGGESGSAVAQTVGPTLGRGGRLDIRPDLTLDGYPGAYAVGDVANIPSGEEGAPTLPQLGSVAQQSGRWAAENILRERGHEPAKPFRYKDKGIMAMIGGREIRSSPPQCSSGPSVHVERFTAHTGHFPSDRISCHEPCHDRARAGSVGLSVKHGQ